MSTSIIGNGQENIQKSLVVATKKVTQQTHRHTKGIARAEEAAFLKRNGRKDKAVFFANGDVLYYSTSDHGTSGTCYRYMTNVSRLLAEEH